jgi:uncharacterized protein YggE
MSDIEITVRGAYTAYAPPERATIKLRVGLEGSDATRVFSAVTETAAAIRASIEPLHDPNSGPVTWWSSEQVRTWAHRPWNKDGKQLPLVHSAVVEFDVKFSDFSALSSWVRVAVDHGGATVSRIDWALTTARRDSLTADVRARAVTEATAKAKAYAAAIGLSSIRAVAIADAGMLGEGLHPSAPQNVAYARAASADAGGADLQFAPQDIAVTAEIDARFVAS